MCLLRVRIYVLWKSAPTETKKRPAVVSSDVSQTNQCILPHKNLWLLLNLKQTLIFSSIFIQVYVSAWTMTWVFRWRKWIYTNKEPCKRSYQFSTCRHFCGLTAAMGLCQELQPSEQIPSYSQGKSSQILLPYLSTVRQKSVDIRQLKRCCSVIRHVRNHFMGLPSPCGHNRGGLKGSLSVWVCVWGQAFVFRFSLLIFCDFIASVWVCMPVWPREGCVSVCRRFRSIVREERTKKIWPTLPSFLVVLWVTSYFKTTCALKKPCKFDYNIICFVFGILSRFLVRNKLLGTTTMLRVRVAVLLTCAQQQTSNHQCARGSLHRSVKFVTQADGHQGETASVAFKYMEYMDINTWICHIRAFISY